MVRLVINFLYIYLIFLEKSLVTAHYVNLAILSNTLQLLNYLQLLKPQGKFKELRNILRIFVFSQYFSGLSKSAFSTFFWETSFSSFYVLYVFLSVMNFEYDLIFTELQHLHSFTQVPPGHPWSCSRSIKTVSICKNI